MSDNFIPLKPIPIKDRISMMFVAMGRIDVKGVAEAAVLAAGEIEPSKLPEEAQRPAISEPESIGDSGHRSG